MPEPTATTEPPDPASNLRKLTDLARSRTIPPTVRSVAGSQMQLDCNIQQHFDLMADSIANSIERTANYRRACHKVEPGKAVREIFFGG